MKPKRDKEKKLKPKRHKGPIFTEDRLNVYWHQHKKNIKNSEILIDFVLKHADDRDYSLARKRMLIEFLTRDNLSFANFYDMWNAAKDILENNKNLNSQFLKSLFEISSADNLLELAEEKMPEAIKELFRKIDTGCFSNRKSLQILIRYFTENSNLEIRKALWKKIKRFNLSDKDLKYLMDLPMMYALPKIISDIQKMLRKRNKKKEIRTIEKINKFIEQIKQGQV